jgi:hypothetical protein
MFFSSSKIYLFYFNLAPIKFQHLTI